MVRLILYRGTVLLSYCLLIALFSSCEKADPSTQADSPSTVDWFQDIDQEIRGGVYGETHSVLLMQDDEMLVESYYDPFLENQLHYLYSVTKSVTSILIGIALDQGLITSLDQRLVDFFPEYQTQTMDAWREEITVEHLLTMQAGFDWDEWSYPYGDDRNDAVKLIISGDMVQHMLDLPMAQRPGSGFLYNSGATMLLGAVLQEVSGMPAENYAAENLFTPLGIEQWQWDRGRDGRTNTGWGLHLAPNDMVKIGQLCLHHGEWQGIQIVSENWVKASTENTGSNYGYQWWIEDNMAYSARGFGGQFIFVIPDKNAVLVTTAGNFTGTSPAGIRIYKKILGSL